MLWKVAEPVRRGKWAVSRTPQYAPRLSINFSFRQSSWKFFLRPVKLNVFSIDVKFAAHRNRRRNIPVPCKSLKVSRLSLLLSMFILIFKYSKYAYPSISVKTMAIKIATIAYEFLYEINDNRTSRGQIRRRQKSHSGGRQRQILRLSYRPQRHLNE